MELIILVILIFINAFFAASEIALISLNDTKIKLMAESGHKKAKLVHNLLSEPSRFLATIQIGITFAGFLASAFASESFSSRLAYFLNSIGVPLSTDILETISLILITLILSYFTLVLGELVPKRLALKRAEPIAMFSAYPLSILSKISYPFVKLLTLSMNSLVRLLGVNPNEDDKKVTEEDIRMMIDVGEEKGTIEEQEKVMINNIFEFNNKNVSDIMTHRTNIVAISSDASLEEVVMLVNNSKYSRIPIYDINLDYIIGILHTKDLLSLLEDNNKTNFDIKDFLRVPYFVLESKRLDELFVIMQSENIQFAIVLDEYGGTDGIVTLEDLIEEIVGKIFDEYDDYKSDIEFLDNYSYFVKGTTNLLEVQELLKIKLPTESYDTLNGFLLGKIGYIPREKQKLNVVYKDFRFTVVDMDDKKINKVKIEKVSN